MGKPTKEYCIKKFQADPSSLEPAKFFENWDDFVKQGDRIKLELADRVELAATVFRDNAAPAPTPERYSATDLERWSRDDWWFARLTLTILVAGREVAQLTSRGRIEVNRADNNSHLTRVANDMVDWGQIINSLIEVSKMELPFDTGFREAAK